MKELDLMNARLKRRKKELIELVFGLFVGIVGIAILWSVDWRIQNWWALLTERQKKWCRREARLHQKWLGGVMLHSTVPGDDELDNEGKLKSDAAGNKSL